MPALTPFGHLHLAAFVFVAAALVLFRECRLLRSGRARVALAELESE